VFLNVVAAIDSLLNFYKVTSEDIMEKRKRRPVHIIFNSKKEMIDMYYRIELSHFLKRLLYNSCETEFISSKKTRD